MPKVKISEYSATANSNTDVASINIDEGCAPSGINNAIRAVMGHLKDFQQGTNGDPFNGPVNGTVGATTANTGAFTSITASTTLGVTGVATFSAGTAALPAITTTGDTNTGIWFPAADTIAFTEGGAESMRIDASGNLGIGTSSITANLQIQRSTPSFWMVETTSGTAQRVEHTVSSVGVYNQNLNWNAGSASRAFTWSQGGTENMRIDSSGNLGLGVAPSAWGSITKNIEGGSGSLNFYSTSQLWLTQNAVWNSGWTYKTTDAATSFQQYQGGYYWYQAASGTAGNALTFNQAMTLDASGNLLVGQTSVSTTTAGAALQQSQGSGKWAFNISGASSSSSEYAHYVYSTTAAAYRFLVNYAGTIFATSTTITAISDQRLKENIRDLDDGLASVMALKPRKFDWKEGKGQDIKNARGFIAQEFETVFPDMIDEWKDPAPEGEEPYKAINANLIPTLVKAIQEQQALITQLTARITALEGA